MNSQQQKADREAKNYLISNIDWSGYDLEDELKTDKEKLQFVADTFRAEYGHAIGRYGYQRALAEWFMGLPSAINVEFRNYYIIELAKAWGSIPENATEKQEEKILNNWFIWMANKLMQLFRAYKVKY